MKKCSKCNEIKSYDEFGLNKSTKDGFQSWCKKCRKEYQQSTYKKINNNYDKYIGEVINGRTRRATKKIDKKIYHMVVCNTCGYDSSKEHYRAGKLIKETWIRRDHLKDRGCGCCNGSIIVSGINDIATLLPEYIKYFPEGYEEAKKYGIGSDQYIYLLCPRCGKLSKEKIQIDYMIRKSSVKCDCCKGISYPERFMECFLKQLNLNVAIQYKPQWSEGKIYDFYFEFSDKKYIIETHGEQHYRDNGIWYRSLKEEQENDKYKMELALRNGIDEYIIIDCRKSNLNWIKNNILDSSLVNIFKLDDIDWELCDEYKIN